MKISIKNFKNRGRGLVCITEDVIQPGTILFREKAFATTNGINERANEMKKIWKQEYKFKCDIEWNYIIFIMEIIQKLNGEKRKIQTYPIRQGPDFIESNQKDMIESLESHVESITPNMKYELKKSLPFFKLFVKDHLNLEETIQWIVGIIETNAHGNEEGDALFAVSSIINHSCEANCTFYIKKDIIAIVNTKPIYSNQEITISYTNPIFARKQRIKTLYYEKHFICHCKRCQWDKPDELEAIYHPCECREGISSYAPLFNKNSLLKRGKNETKWKCLNCDLQIKENELRFKLNKITETVCELKKAMYLNKYIKTECPMEEVPFSHIVNYLYLRVKLLSKQDDWMITFEMLIQWVEQHLGKYNQQYIALYEKFKPWKRSENEQWAQKMKRAYDLQVKKCTPFI